MSLFTAEELRKARDRFERQQSAARAEKMAADRAAYDRQQQEAAERASVPVPTEKGPFVYMPRTIEQLEKRIQQGRDTRRKWTRRGARRKG